MADWTSVLELDGRREPTSGSTTALTDAIRAGADLRIGTAFRHNEHIDVNSDSDELVQEVMDFRVTYLIADSWVAGIQNLRMPVALPDGFGPRPSMSFFLYNQDGHQAIARPFLDGLPAKGEPSSSPIELHEDMPKYHELASFDRDTNAPSSSFIYDFEFFRYYVRSAWEQVLGHDAEGRVEMGSLELLAGAFAEGREIKIAVRGLCDDFCTDNQSTIDHEVFIHLGACYYYNQSRLFMASANPIVRTRPAMPLGYTSRGWDFGWLMPRSDGHVARWLCDPYTLRFNKTNARYAIRWFASR